MQEAGLRSSLYHACGEHPIKNIQKQIIMDTKPARTGDDTTDLTPTFANHFKRMDRMKIPGSLKTKQHALWIITAFCCLGYASTLAFEAALKSSGSKSLLALSFAIPALVLTLRFLALLFEETTIHLVSSKPPLLVTNKIWLGKFSTTKKLEILGGAWVRTRREVIDSDLLVVEIGTNGYQTTAIKYYPYSEDNIPIAKNLCSEIANFLALEDKGYRIHA